MLYAMGSLKGPFGPHRREATAKMTVPEIEALLVFVIAILVAVVVVLSVRERLQIWWTYVQHKSGHIGVVQELDAELASELVRVNLALGKAEQCITDGDMYWGSKWFDGIKDSVAIAFLTHEKYGKDALVESIRRRLNHVKKELGVDAAVSLDLVRLIAVDEGLWRATAAFERRDTATAKRELDAALQSPAATMLAYKQSNLLLKLVSERLEAVGKELGMIRYETMRERMKTEVHNITIGAPLTGWDYRPFATDKITDPTVKIRVEAMNDLVWEYELDKGSALRPEEAKSFENFVFYPDMAQDFLIAGGKTEVLIHLYKLAGRLSQTYLPPLEGH